MVRLLCVMMMNCECARNRCKHADEAVDVGLVQRGVQLVQHAERAGLDLVNREQQRHGGHGLLAAGQQRDGLQLFARRAGDDVNAAFEQVVLVHQHQVGFAAAEDLGEHGPEVVPDFLEGLPEHLAGLDVDAVDDFEQLRLGLDQVVVLLAEELVALLGFLVFLDGHQVHRPHLVDALLQASRPAGRPPSQSVAAPAAAISSGVITCTLAGPSSA